MSIYANNEAVTSQFRFSGSRSLLTCAIRTALLGASLSLPSAYAARVEVNGFTDDGAGPLCTLREAIAAVNAGGATSDCINSGAEPFGTNDTIVFSAANTTTLVNGALSIAEDVTIDASSVGGATIDAAMNSPVIDLQADRLTLTGLTITGGSTTYAGGGIHAPQATTLTLSDSVVTGNQAQDEGGGIYLNSSTGTTSSLVLSNSTVSGNTSNYGRGGGIALVGNHSVVELNDVTLSTNTALYDGGGLYIGANEVDLTLANSTVTGNVASNVSGGGLHINAPDLNVTLSDSVISGNVAGFDGGGLYLYGTSATLAVANLQNMRLENNTAGAYALGFGGALYARYTSASIVNSTITMNGATQNGGAIAQIDSAITLQDTTLSGNTAAQDGGAIYSENADLTLIQTTVSSNFAGIMAGHDGAGIWISGGALVMRNSTLSGNSAAGVGGGLYNYSDVGTLTHVTFSGNQAGGSGGGLEDASGVLSVINSIVANSIAGGDCSGGAMIDSASIIEDGSCSATRSGDPKLLALEDNGGATLTHGLHANSIAINTASAAQCLALDQRSEARVAARCDVGAFEYIDQSMFYVISSKDGRVVVVPL
jgi:predicted outer membrane repeat protein